MYKGVSDSTEPLETNMFSVITKSGQFVASFDSIDDARQSIQDTSNHIQYSAEAIAEFEVDSDESDTIGG